MDTTYSSGATGLPGDGAPAGGTRSTDPSGTGSSATGSSGSSGSSGSIGSTGSSGASGSGDMQSEAGPALREELASMKKDLDALLARASTLSDRELSRARDQLMSQFNTMQESAKGMAVQARQQLDRSVDLTSDYVRDKPLQSVAIAAGVGMLLSVILGRD
jgi:ElaB/YqjD/DUF883 family membrane-anchored ribosome-binding protein